MLGLGLGSGILELGWERAGVPAQELSKVLIPVVAQKPRAEEASHCSS